jgi:hypothetical protein
MKVSLDLVYEKWREENIVRISEKFLETQQFEDYVEEMWREYQDKNNLIDESNESIDEIITEVNDNIQQG